MPNKKKQKVKFISYSGTYPCLCNGILILEVEGVQYKEFLLHSRGECYWDSEKQEECHEYGPWSVLQWPDNFPKKLKKEALKVINDNIEQGCCGGCM
jgi:hypothetical protein